MAVVVVVVVVVAVVVAVAQNKELEIICDCDGSLTIVFSFLMLDEKKNEVDEVESRSGTDKKGTEKKGGFFRIEPVAKIKGPSICADPFAFLAPRLRFEYES